MTKDNLSRVAGIYGMRATVCCSVLQCVAVCCSVLQCALEEYMECMQQDLRERVCVCVCRYGTVIKKVISFL